MTDEELRAIVRDAVARHLGGGGRPAAAPPAVSAPPAAPASGHPSHAVYLTLVNTGDACVIEPSVPCSHCQYCRSHGY
jgi:threonine dehydrogenase-like Zn-dependent dehydrogenase